MKFVCATTDGGIDNRPADAAIFSAVITDVDDLDFNRDHSPGEHRDARQSAICRIEREIAHLFSRQVRWFGWAQQHVCDDSLWLLRSTKKYSERALRMLIERDRPILDKGRNHNWFASIALFAGGGVRGGQIIGATDGTGGKVADPGWNKKRSIYTEDVTASMYSTLGMDCRAFEYLEPVSGTTLVDFGDITPLFD